MMHQLTATPFQDDVHRLPSITWTVSCEKVVSYQVVVMPNLLDPDNPTLIEAGSRQEFVSHRRFVVIDRTVDELYGDRLRTYLCSRGITARICSLPISEPTKIIDSVLRICRELDDFGIDRRREPIIGIGGGVLLDVVGLAASLYRRHTPYIRVPTTVVGLIDAGIGAKTGVNFDGHKNRIGSYEPPAAALLDRTFVATLDERQISNGLAEIVKIGLVKDRKLFELVEAHGPRMLAERLQGVTPVSEAATREMLRRAVQGMLEELQPNLWEQRLERLVDYGHSFSPALEMAALPALLHGEAVAIDMALTTVLGCRRGLVCPTDRDRVLAALRGLRLPVWHPLCEPRLLGRALTDTTRHRNGLQRLPVPVGIGQAVFVNDVSADELAESAFELADLAVSS